MLTQNYTGDEKQKTFHEFDCPDEFTGEDYKYLILLAALNIFLSFTAFLGNTLILVALRKESSLHPPSKLLYRNLAITDFLCWRHRRTCVCYILDVSGDGTVESLSNHLGQICYNW